MTLVTPDQRTIVPLLKVWGEQGIDYHGVIVVSARRFGQRDGGALVAALVALSLCRSVAGPG